MADENNQAAPFTRPTAFSMYPNESNPDPQSMNRPPPYSPNPQYPQPQQPYLPPQYQPAPGMAPYPQPQNQPAPGTAPYENNQAAPFTRPTAFSMYPNESNPDPQPMNRPPPYSPNPQYPQPQQPYLPPQYQPAPGMAPYPQPQNQPAPGMTPYPQPQNQPAPGVAPYPQPQYPPAPGLAPYPQPQYYVPPPQQQQQEQQSSNVVFIRGQPAPVTFQQRSYIDFTGPIILSCFVMLCFGSLICGGIAFILAMVGLSSASSGNERRACRLRTCSQVLSIAGAISSIIILAVVIPVTLSSTCSYGYLYNSRNVKTCCAYLDSSMDCGSYGYYYSGGIKHCCPFK